MHRSPSRKSALAFAAAMLAAACLLFLFDLRTYPIQPDRSNLTDCIATVTVRVSTSIPRMNPRWNSTTPSPSAGKPWFCLTSAVLWAVPCWRKTSWAGTRSPRSDKAAAASAMAAGNPTGRSTWYSAAGILSRKSPEPTSGSTARCIIWTFPPPRSWSAHRFSIPAGMEPWTSVSSRFTTARARISQTAIISAAAAFNHISDPTEKSGDA